jgi:4-hydroxy-3-methylbut-2-enyl diphosphate reductase
VAEIHHKPAGGKHEVVTRDWLPSGPLAVGLTSGASTPDNLVERVIRRLDSLINGDDDAEA